MIYFLEYVCEELMSILIVNFYRYLKYGNRKHIAQELKVSSICALNIIVLGIYQQMLDLRIWIQFYL